MIHKVDYFSYSKNLWGKREKPGELSPKVYAPITFQHIPDYMPQDGWEVVKPRKFTVFGLSYDKHCAVWLGHDGIITIEHTGLGCDYLLENGLLWDVIAKFAEQATRVDIATDILTDVDPIEFLDKRGNKTTKSFKIEHTKSGTTYNIGSKTSERHAKVYRYTEPHPRHKFLRIEYTFHREDAKIVARECSAKNLPDLAIRAGLRYKWGHPCYQPHENATMDELKAWKPNRRGGKTVYWLHSQVVPAIAKAVKNHELDLDDFIAAIRAAADSSE